MRVRRAQFNFLFLFMLFLISILSLFGQIDVSGYLETRPLIAWNNSVNIYGYNRGWLEFKTSGLNCGTQIAFDCIVQYDTTHIVNILENINVSRLMLWLGPENLRIIAGKQRLYWGVAKVFRPLDVFNPINFFEPGYKRPGSNAILGYLSIGKLTSLRGIYIPQHNFKKSLLGLRIGTNLYKNDIGLNFIHKPSDLKRIVGFEVTGDLILGYWGEFSYTWEDSVQYGKASLGCDYTFSFPLYSMVEFFYDGNGENNPQKYDITKIISGERVTLARQYLYISIGWVHDPFFRPSINSVINLNDRGVILIPRIYYSIFENAELTFGLNYFLGPNSSEFRVISSFDGQAYIWARVYF